MPRRFAPFSGTVLLSFASIQWRPGLDLHQLFRVDETMFCCAVYLSA